MTPAKRATGQRAATGRAGAAASGRAAGAATGATGDGKRKGSVPRTPAPAKKVVKRQVATKKATPPAKAPAKKATAKAPAKKAVAKAPAKKAAGRATATATATKAKAKPAARRPAAGTPVAKGAAKAPHEARPYAKDTKFLDEQRVLLEAERTVYQEQAADLKAEADSLAQEREPGDVQFDEESGEGGTVTVDRERDLALSAQALVAVEEIDDALARIAAGTYGACERCHQPIPKPRLRALPYARLCVACKSGGLSRR
jgi:DnaK suppressor protein